MSARPLTHSNLPEPLQSLAGQIVDVDSHEMAPAQVWVREYGPIAEAITREWLSNGQDVRQNPNHPNVPGYELDDAPIDPASIWRCKGSPAPGALDLRRRNEVMDAMGIEKQLVFATGIGMWGVFLVTNADDPRFASSITGNRREYGHALVRAYNEWMVRKAYATERIRPVLPLMAERVDELIDAAREVIDAGIRAVWLPSSVLPGGVSPAHSDLDPLWSLMTQHDITVCLHVGADNPFPTRKWGEAPVFEGFRLLGEFNVDPWSLSINYLTTQNFLATMVVGGVFERHPALRFGVIETGGYWIGPLCDQMDMWYEHSASFGTAKSFRLPRRPSEYVRRNVRVSCFDFEHVDTYITRYSLEDVLCFASDYPHIEGGTDPAGRWYARLAPLGADVVRKFFVTNGRWLLPD